MATTPIITKDYTSGSGRTWKWCGMCKCWQFNDYVYKIYLVDGIYTCASNSVWHAGSFDTFEDAEAEVCS